MQKNSSTCGNSNTGGFNFPKVKWEFTDDNASFLSPTPSNYSRAETRFIDVINNNALRQIHAFPNTRGTFLDLVFSSSTEIAFTEMAPATSSFDRATQYHAPIIVNVAANWQNTESIQKISNAFNISKKKVKNQLAVSVFEIENYTAEEIFESIYLDCSVTDKLLMNFCDLLTLIQTKCTKKKITRTCKTSPTHPRTINSGFRALHKTKTFCRRLHRTESKQHKRSKLHPSSCMKGITN